MMKRVLVVLAEGFEEMEAIAPIDLLRRAGADVTIAAIGGMRRVAGRNSIRLEADQLWEDLTDTMYDLIVVPGGPSTKALRGHAGLRERLCSQSRAGGLVAAICAAPVILLDAGLLKNRAYTAHGSVANELPGIRPDAVVEDRGIITSRGAGTAVEFGLHLVGRLYGPGTRNEIAASIHYRP